MERCRVSEERSRPRAASRAFAFVALALLGQLAGLPRLARGAPTDLGTPQSRGEYLARAADCQSCHTKAGGKPFAGGEELKTPFGSMFGANITSDPDTGIGKWTEADFDRALRSGLDDAGKPIYPAMPYANYTKLSDADLHALWTYIHAIPAVKNSPPKNTLSFPFNIRDGVFAWQALYFKPGRFQPAADKDATWNRGAYLVDALGHCDQCHTPRNLAQATEAKHELTGAQIEGWYAPDISHDPLSELKHYDIDALVHYLKTGQTFHNTKAVGPMQEVVHNSLQYLTDEDIRAMAVYLKQQRVGPVAVSVAAATISPQELATGKALYENECSSCHQSNGKGTNGSVPALAGNTLVTAPEPYNIIMSMLQGYPPQGTYGAMGSFAHLSNEQIADIANYVRVAWNNHAEPNANLWAVGNWRKTAETPPGGQQPALMCASLTPQVLRPALAETPKTLVQAASDRRKLAEVVRKYERAVPNGNPAQTIEALSIAYCRAIANDQSVPGQREARIANFSEQIAIVLSQGSGPDNTGG